MNQKNLFKGKENGITLIALVITIIVLLILAGVAISMLSGENGILKQAADAKTETENASLNEEIKVATMSALTIGNGKIKGEKALKTLNDGLKEMGCEEVDTLPAKIKTDGGTYFITENGHIKEPLKNKYDANAWDIAYTYTPANGWSNAITNKNANLKGNIIAKLYATGGTATTEDPLTGATLEGVPEYKLVMEGIGEMGPISNQDQSEFYAWFEDTTNGRVCLTEVTICDGITSIADYAFINFKVLERANIATTVSKIGNSAFLGCTMLKEIDLSGVNILGDEVFEECTKLTTVNALTLTNIGRRAFYFCESLEHIDLPNVTEIGSYAFYSCANLKEVKTPKVISIGEVVFKSCQKLESIELSSTLTTIPNNAFANCRAIEKIEIPNSVTSIGENAFQLCNNLKTIKIPNSVTSIGKNAFMVCTKLTDVYYSGTSTEWNNIAINATGNNYLTSATIHYDSF